MSTPSSMLDVKPRTVNVTRRFRACLDHEVEHGMRWYADAQQIAADLAMQSGRTLDTCVGIIAALSPRSEWETNVKLATHIILTGDTSGGYLGRGLRQADRMLAGESALAVLGGQKVRNFHLSIMTAGIGGIVIDRHAYDIATGIRHGEDTRPTIGVGRYAACAEVYRRASRILSRERGTHITPAQLQAATWVSHRNQLA